MIHRPKKHEKDDLMHHLTLGKLDFFPCLELYDSSSRQINLLLQNIREIGKKCMSYKVKYVFMFFCLYMFLTFNNKISHK